MEIFKRSLPEAEGVPSEKIAEFIERLEEKDITMHSLLLLKNNRLIFDGYYRPFERDSLHRMFSVTKSFVSAAIGVLYGKGILELDDSVIKYFPEYDGEDLHEFSKGVTVRDLLEMKSQHYITAYKQTGDKDYIRAFFNAAPGKTPGTVFTYEDGAAHTLCALVEKLAGRELLDFLRDEFLREAGFSEGAYCLKDPMGRSLGGSGLMASSMDMAVFANIFLNEGRIGNRQVIPKDYVLEATSYRTDTYVKGRFREERSGYGYFLWRLPIGGYMCYGIGGQLGVVLPDKGFVMVTTADTLERRNGVGDIFEAFEACLLPYIGDKPLCENKTAALRLEALKNSLEIKALKCEIPPYKAIYKAYGVRKNGFGIRALRLYVCEEKGELLFEDEKASYSLTFGINKNLKGRLPFYGYTCISSADVKDENNIIIKAHVIDTELSAVYIQLGINKKGQGTLIANSSLPDVFSVFNCAYILDEI